jgi:hypothetical protein
LPKVIELVAVAAISAPVLDERPTDYADRIGSEIVGHKSAVYRKQIGIYLTPVEVADFIAAAYENNAPTVRILDPAAGSGTLACALVEALAGRSERKPRSVELIAYEIDPELADALGVVIGYLEHWAARRNVSFGPPSNMRTSCSRTLKDCAQRETCSISAATNYSIS